MTGVVEEYLALAEEADADLLAMQVGDFYEFFADDARTVADELDLKLSEKSAHGSSYPMAGVPVEDLSPYLVALVERGYRVAVADQQEEGGDISRAVSRVVTPGTVVEGVDGGAQYLAAVVADDRFGLAFADVTTGQFRVTQVGDRAAALAELYRFDPVEVLLGPAIRDDDALVADLEEAGVTVTHPDADAFAPGRAAATVREQFGDAAESVGLEGAAVRAAGGALDYVATTRGVTGSLTRLNHYRADEGVALDATTQRNLELVETMQGDSEGSLLATVDHTVTSPGRRLLREWLTRPRRDRATLDRRLDSVAALATAALRRQRLQETLDGAADLERLASRVASGSAGANELLSIRETLALLPDIADELADGDLADSPLPAVLDGVDRAAAADLRETLAEAIVDDPPQTVTQGGLFKRGYHDDLDDLIE